MIKTKSAILYVIIIFLVIMLFASFEAEQYFAYSSRMNLTDNMMYRAMTKNFEGIFLDDDDTGTAVDDKTEFELDDVSDKITPYTMKLYYLDYIKDYPQTPNVFDEVLYDAVFDYQKAKGFTENGILNKETTDALTIEAVEYKKGKTGNEILTFQLILSQLGYLHEDIEMNGTFGDDTEAAVIKYQEAHGLIVTGTITAETQLSLKKDISEQIPYTPSE